MKRFIIITALLCTALLLVSCGDGGTDFKQQQETDALMQELHKQVGLPNIKNFQQKKLMKMIFELNDQENLLTYVYLKSDYTGKLIYVGEAIGFGVPFSAQYTNPTRISKLFGNRYKMPQPDPNGLFMPTSSSATWVMMMDPEGNPRPVYFEPEIVVSPFKLN